MGKKISLYGMAVFYIIAGANHFLHPDTYYKIIPSYLPNPVFLNIVSGLAEIILGLLLFFSVTRKIAALGIIILLIAFIPAHVVMIQQGFCLTNGFCLPVWAAWIRLIPLQFLLIWWAWVNRK